MNYSLYDNLDKKYISELLKKLKKIILQKDLISIENNDLSTNDFRVLAESANILAVSSDIEDKLIALEIAVSLPQINKNKGIYLSSFLALRKLGNYPAIKLLEKVTEIGEYKTFLSGISALEEYIFESFNEKKLMNESYLLTNFQNKVFHLLNNNRFVSLSAPTSAGKSFILLKYILDMIYKREEGVTVVYIVPTRALIKQVMNDFTENISKLNLENIYIGCSSEVESALKNPKKSNVLVLTQERLFQLCTKPDIKKLNIKMVIADEAHNIQSEGRGVLLEGAINYVTGLFPSAKILFSSPLVSNPEKLLSTFKFEGGQPEKDNLPLVSQNIIKVKKTNKFITISSNYMGEDIEIAKLNYENNSNSKASILANVALRLWNSNTSIIYSSEPILSSNITRILYESGNFPEMKDERLEEFAEFIEEYISEKYELAMFVRCGLAFHFGSLPPIIRSGIEELFKEGAIKIVCCTSTLLEGLNMPAKNIFIYKPEKGQGKPIDKLNFWNLAGRAGRMGNDFSGNIICIDPDSWDENPLIGEKQYPIIPSSEFRLKYEAKQFKEFITDRDTPSGIDDYNEQLLSLVVRNRLVGNKMIDSSYLSNDNEKYFIEIDNTTEKIIEEFLPPVTLLNSIQGIVPDRINDFWIFLLNNQENYMDFMPIKPIYLYDRGYNRFKLIVKLINEFFVNNNIWSEVYVKKLSITGYRWMTGQSLSQIIFYRKGTNEYEGRQLTSYVKGEIDFLNSKIRYQLVKYTQIYTQVLQAFLETIDKKEESEKIIKLSSYLEYGACAAPALEFMALGLPREAAIRLSQEFNINIMEEPSYYIEWLRKIDINTIEMPNYLRKQIRSIQKII
ncbi:DEAD/DEAH box helicase [Metabacillus indicus]|uniref:DEAD/DEAH box helicase n=1 Tax=Metabacillus indicus TaxID=246786 RepID=UPI003CEE4888